MAECIVCGCTDSTACMVDGQACSWVEIAPGVFEINGGGLCSFCAELAEAEPSGQFLDEVTEAFHRGFDKQPDSEREEPLVQLVTDHEADMFLRERRRL